LAVNTDEYYFSPKALTENNPLRDKENEARIPGTFLNLFK